VVVDAATCKRACQTSHFLLGTLIALCSGWLQAAGASAQVMPVRTSIALGAATMISKDQAGRMQYDLDALLESAVPPSRVELLAPVLFKFDSDVLEPVGIAMLHEVARELASRKDIELLEIQGYADARGSTEYNEALSARRAERVRLWLVAHGVATERLSVAARGATQPVEPARSAAAYEQNRRVVFRVKRLQGEPNAQN
jgi:outer membrane protein OmpA-like peptidoglycan-associated protein